MTKLHWNQFVDTLAEAEQQTEAVATELLKLDIANQLDKQLEAQNINKTIFAARLDSSKSYVTKVLQGDANLTLASLVKLAKALDTEVHLRILPKGISVRDQWIGVVDETNKQATSAHIHKSWSASPLNAEAKSYAGA